MYLIYTKSFLKQIAIYILFVLMAGYFIINSMLNEIKEELIVENQKQMLVAAKYLDNTLANRLLSSEEIAEALAVFTPDSRETVEYLRQVKKKSPSISHINVINMKGRIIESTVPTGKGLNVAGREYFQQVLKTEKPYISDIYTSLTTRAKVVSFAVPIKKNGKMVGVLGTVFKLDSLQDNIRQIIKQRGGEMVISVVDGRGRVIYSSNTSHILADLSQFPAVQQALADKTGTSEYFAPIMHQWRLFSFSPLEKAHWGIIVSQPTARVYQLVSYVAVRFLAVVFLLFLPIIFLFSHLFRVDRLRKLEVSEMEREKARTVNELAASVAHEIRNPLTSIRGFMQLLTRNNLPEKAMGYVKIIIDEVDRLEGIIGEFLSFARNKGDAMKICDLQEVLKTTYFLAEGRSTYSKVKVKLEAPDSLRIMGNPSQLQQAFINLCINSIQAMPKGGFLKIRLYQEESKVVVLFSDTGCGMPPEILKKLGEVYFSTKEEGTGLGLAVSYRILSRHSANVFVSSQVGQGSTFRIEFPLVE